MPKGSVPPFVIRFDAGSVPVGNLVFSSETRSETELQDFAVNRIRLEHMDRNGIWAEVLYPNVAGFGGQKFLMLDDRELMYECVRAYNDFQTDFCSVSPKRLIPLTNLPFWELDASIAELERCHEMVHKGVNLGLKFERLGFLKNRTNSAAARGVQLTKVSSTVTGDIDLLGILGLADGSVRNGYEQIKVTFHIEGDADADTLRDLVEQSRRRSAVYDALTNPTPVVIDVVTV